MLRRSSLTGLIWVIGQAAVLVLWLRAIPGMSELLEIAGSSLLLLVPALISIAFGVLLVFSATIRLGQHLTPSPEPKASGVLVQSGIYSCVRHPMYGGILLLVWGLTLPVIHIPASLITAFVVTLFFYGKSRYEESRLTIHYPDYGTYKGQTSRFLPLRCLLRKRA